MTSNGHDHSQAAATTSRNSIPDVVVATDDTNYDELSFYKGQQMQCRFDIVYR